MLIVAGFVREKFSRIRHLWMRITRAQMMHFQTLTHRQLSESWQRCCHLARYRYRLGNNARRFDVSRLIFWFLHDFAIVQKGNCGDNTLIRAYFFRYSPNPLLIRCVVKPKRQRFTSSNCHIDEKSASKTLHYCPVRPFE